MHINDQGTTTPEGIPAAPIDPTNNEPPVVPGNYSNNTNSSADPASPPIESPMDNQEVKPEEEKKEPESPEWFMKDKFKTIDDQAKSYSELHKKMGKYWGSPQDNYSVEGLQGIDVSDPLIAGLTPALKEMGISQDGFNHLVNQYMDANKNMMKDMEDNLRKTLTETDAHTYHAIDKWMTDNLTQEESVMVKNNWLMTPEDFKLFNNLRLMAAPSTNVPSASSNPVKYESSNEVTNEKIKYKKELKAGTRVQDKNHEDALAARFRDAAARELRNKGR